MKKIYLIVSLALGTFTSIAQTKDTKIADNYFKQYEYVNASKEYLKIVEKSKADNYVYKQLGDCYFNIFNPVEAEKWYSKVISNSKDPETYFRYAQMLKANKKYEEANAIMKKFALLAPNDSRAANAEEEPNYLANLIGSKKKFDISPIDLNSKYSDFGAQIFDNTIYFVSTRNTARKSEGWNDQPKIDIYKVDYIDNKLSGSPVALDDLNTKFHEGPVCLSADGKTAYFSRESFFENKFEKSADKKTKFGKMFLYKAVLKDGKWGNITALPINGKEFYSTSPSLSKDGSTLYFSSNRPGGKGGNDIWKVAVKADGTYGTPENLGDKVNTEGSEQFPFIADDGTLYFSSNGKKGLGGLDVFAFNADNQTVINLGKPVNSEKDDFAFSFNQSKNIAFLSSNRDGGTGDDDVYLATPVCSLDLLVKAHNAKTGSVLSQTLLTVTDADNNLVRGVTNENGEAVFQLDCDKDYAINAEHNGFVSQTFPLAKSRDKATLAADLNPTEAVVTETEVILNEILFDYNKSNITLEGAMELDKLVEVMNKYPNMVIFVKSHTDNRGNDKYNMQLSDRRAKSTVQYVISKGINSERITGQGFGETEPKVVCEECTEVQHAQNRRSEFMIVKK